MRSRRCTFFIVLFALTATAVAGAEARATPIVNLDDADEDLIARGVAALCLPKGR